MNDCCEYSEKNLSPIVKKSKHDKYYQEILTEMIGNTLLIKFEKDPMKKLKKLSNNNEPSCDCEMIEIRRPGKGENGAKIINGGDKNQIIFKINSKTRLSKDHIMNNEKRQSAIAYKVGACDGGSMSNDQCRTVTVFPEFGGPGSQEVHSDHVTDGNDDVFLLRINKKGDNLNPMLQRNIELELRTPRPPTPESKPEIKMEENIHNHEAGGENKGDKKIVEKNEKGGKKKKKKKKKKE